MAFFYAEDRHDTGALFGSKEKFKGLMIGINTAELGEPDRSMLITGWANDGSQSYDHLTQRTRFAGCRAKRPTSTHETIMRIRYEKEVLIVEVWLLTLHLTTI